MSINIQIRSIILFFTLGNYLYLAYYFLKYKIKKEKYLYIVFPLMTLLFMIILYNSNSGKIHLYFIIVMLIGILFSKVCVNITKKIIYKWNNNLKK